VSYVRPSGSALRVLAHPDLDADPDPVTETVAGAAGCWSWQVGSGGFWQAHRGAPAVLVGAVLAAVGDHRGPVVDLYAGAGLFPVPQAERCGGPVVAVEADPQAVRWLRHNTAGRPVDCRAGDVAQVVADLAADPPAVVVADPPRSGAGLPAVAAIARLRARQIVYVGCDPAGLARDVSGLVQAGYQLDTLRAFDLFPMTHHVECLAVLHRPTP
jgi:tRNA/tmRNA/rRNA uracil-C5-methylase (TrmA/RlmC/RlmD family)